jgi:hypothetical protein
MTTLDSLLHIAKSKTNGNWVNGSFCTVLNNCLLEAGYKILNIKGHKNGDDAVTVQVSNTKVIVIKVDGNSSAYKILKQIEKRVNK